MMHCIISRSNRGVVLRALSLGRFRRYDFCLRQSCTTSIRRYFRLSTRAQFSLTTSTCVVRMSNLHEPICCEVMTIVLSKTRAVKIGATGVAWVCILESAPYLGQFCCFFSFLVSWCRAPKNACQVVWDK